MSTDSGQDGDVIRVPIGVFEGIADVEDGNTASKEDLEDVLKF